jgi:predicted amidophosphoribosyltransferase
VPALATVLDAVVPDTCVGCGEPGPPLCAGCSAELHRESPRRRDPTPRPPALPPVTASGAYAGTLRAALLSYKERGRTRLADPLARLLAAAVLCAWLTGSDTAGPVTIVAVPSTGRAKRERGHCHVDTLAAGVVVALRDAGVPARRIQALRRRGRVRDSAGLSAADRAHNGGAFVVRRHARRALIGETLIVVDDIVTTGATALAVTAALQAAGASVIGVAAVAATTRRLLVKVPDGV